MQPNTEILFRYTDGTGGCDGCLNWKGVGFVHQDAPNQQLYPNVGETNNNGLECTVMLLEQIYTNAAFPNVRFHIFRIQTLK